MPSRTWPSLLGLAALLAGCAAPAPEGPSAPSVWDAIEAAIGAPIVEEHDHRDGAAHRGAYNLERIAASNGRAPGMAKPPTEAYAETAVKDGWAYLTRYGPEGGLVILDVRDPERPEPVGYLRLDVGFEPDIEVSDDGRWAFWETQRFPTSLELPSLDPGANLPRGVHIIDVADKANPRWAGFSPTPPDGPHSITYARIGQRDILLQSVYAMAYAYAGVEVPGAQRLVVSELDLSGPAPALRTLAEYFLPGAEGQRGVFPHDVSVQRHPRTGQWLAYVAWWNAGLVILDLTDPAQPRLVSQFTDVGPAEYVAAHMARAFPHPIAGRHVTVLEPEIGAQPDSGYLTFVDTTDPADPRYISSWKKPGNITSAGGALGPHYFDLADGRVALASYHAGFWVVDVHDEANLLRPRTAAFAEVDASGGAALPGPAGPLGAAPSAFDAWWYRGYVYGGDVHGGLVVYRYTGPSPAPVP